MVNPLSDHPAPPADLIDHLQTQGLVGTDVKFETLYGGRTNQVWKVLGNGNDRVLKLYDTSMRNPLFRNDAALEARCLSALDGSGLGPRLRATGRHQNTGWVFYDHAPGTPWRQGSAKVGRLLRRLHHLAPPIPAPLGCNGSRDLERHGQRILDGCTSDTRHELEALRPNTECPASAKTCLIHGDPVAGNILVAVDGLTLIDWQCPAIGDPCEDLAMFLSPAMQQLYRGKPLSPDEKAAFLHAYENPGVVDRYHALQPWFAWRMAAYCLWRIEQGTQDYQAGLDLELDLLRATT